ncbi:MAG: hydrogenase nickel incorporation protein HypB [Nitrospinae bacterium]|nr:hydrogenase nickel incorporation protein HypB [Nitrospinota bacterium]MBF0633882.1 hydrogenase nickel incorporation protein HypB [Nitrospinota bacterium]
MMAKTLEIRKNVLAKNDEIARENREFFQSRGLAALNFVSSPGAGKTSLIVRTINDLKARVNFAVIEGDQQTDNDAKKIEQTGAQVVQINTVSSCHLDADMIKKSLGSLDMDGAKYLFIENVGNLVCPASYDLGEMMKVAVMSVTEGEDKPVKYPKMFRVSSALVITKTDLLPYLDFDVDLAVDYALKVNPAIKVFKVSVKNGEGLEGWYNFLLTLSDAAGR